MEAEDKKNASNLPDDVRLAIFTNVRQTWLNTRESFTIQYRVMKRIGKSDEMKRIEEELKNCELALDELDKIFDDMQKTNANKG